MEEMPANVSKTGNGVPAKDYRSSGVLLFAGRLVSFVFHPLFIPSGICFFLLYIHPYAFAETTDRGKLLKLISVFFITAFLPAFSVFLMKQLGFVTSIFLRSQRDRIIPYIVSMIYYFWAWYVSKNLHDNPALVAMLLCTFISSIAALMCNIFFKISMHGIAAGAFFIFFLWLAISGGIPLGSFPALATLAAGLVCTARLLVSDHTPYEIYAGLVIGMICQLAAIGIVA